MSDDVKQPALPLGEEIAEAVARAERREEFARNRWRPAPAEQCRQRMMFEHMDDLPDQTYLFGE